MLLMATFCWLLARCSLQLSRLALMPLQGAPPLCWLALLTFETSSSCRMGSLACTVWLPRRSASLLLICVLLLSSLRRFSPLRTTAAAPPVSCPAAIPAAVPAAPDMAPGIWKALCTVELHAPPMAADTRSDLEDPSGTWLPPILSSPAPSRPPPATSAPSCVACAPSSSNAEHRTPRSSDRGGGREVTAPVLLPAHRPPPARPSWARDGGNETKAVVQPVAPVTRHRTAASASST
mmetsp:Transcript_21286/g.53621  ORF Transcript_21286/g.53621 Transcript_21286/m.53621 type:complete len:236 (+) Transcript_21286:1974-2681(+)